jgi:peptidoglycan/LPS O-acetylase OafA/YrhL
MLHSLNALRALAELWVVHTHLAAAPTPALKVFGSDLMSAFFVLSGFVGMHACREVEFAGSWEAKSRFWWRQAARVYPLYIVFWVWDMLGAFVRLGSGCLQPCYVAQLAMMNVWMGCGINILVLPSWFLATLMWVWLAFPVLHPAMRWAFSTHPWAKIGCIYLASLACTSCLIELHYDETILWTLPPLRALEFVIGCAASTTIERRVHWAWAVLSGACITACVVLSNYLTVDEAPLHSLYVSKLSVAWAVGIQWFAASEHGDVQGRAFAWLETNPVLRSLSKMSLQVYLGHQAFAAIINFCTQTLRFYHPWATDTLLLATYSACYGVFAYVQPMLDECVGRKQV